MYFLVGSYGGELEREHETVKLFNTLAKSDQLIVKSLMVHDCYDNKCW